MPEYPYYPTYPKDLNGDHKVILMDNRTYGVYRRLLDIAWHEDPAATLPADDRILAVYAKETLEGWREVAPLVLSCFQKRNGRYWQKRLRSEWEKLASVRAKQSEAGRRRWSNEVSCSSPNSSPHARASGSGSGSENPESGSSGNGVVSEIVRLSLLAHSAFGPAPNYPNSVVSSNVSALLHSGRAVAAVEALIEWRRTTKHTHAPKGPQSLTDPEKWEQWHTQMKEQPNNGNTKTSAQRGANRVEAEHGKYAGVAKRIEEL